MPIEHMDMKHPKIIVAGIGPGNFIVEGRYYYALSDFYGSTKKDFFSRSAHGVITAKITYLFDLKK